MRDLCRVRGVDDNVQPGRQYWGGGSRLEMATDWNSSMDCGTAAHPGGMGRPMWCSDQPAGHGS